MIERKFIQFDFKALSEKGEFSGIASSYGNVDLGGDIVMPGAFQSALDERGPERPILWQHRSDSPIGLGTFKETDSALLIERATLELSLPEAQKAYTLLRAGIVKGLSIGYEAVTWEWRKSDDPEAWPVRVIKAAKLWETSVVTFPMNEQAIVTAVKAFDQPLLDFFGSEISAGRSLSQKHLEMLRTAHGNLSALLAKADATKPATPEIGEKAALALIEQMRATIQSQGVSL